MKDYYDVIIGKCISPRGSRAGLSTCSKVLSRRDTGVFGGVKCGSAGVKC